AKAGLRLAVASQTTLPVRFNPPAPPAEPAAMRSEPAGTSTQARAAVGSTDPIRPVLVKTLTVKAGVRTASLGALPVAAPAGEPQPVATAAPAPTPVAAAKPEAAAPPPAPVTAAKPEPSPPPAAPVAAAKPEPPAPPPAPAVAAKAEPAAPAPEVATNPEPPRAPAPLALARKAGPPRPPPRPGARPNPGPARGPAGPGHRERTPRRRSPRARRAGSEARAHADSKACVGRAGGEAAAQTGLDDSGRRLSRRAGRQAAPLDRPKQGVENAHRRGSFHRSDR